MVGRRPIESAQTSSAQSSSHQSDQLMISQGGGGDSPQASSSIPGTGTGMTTVVASIFSFRTRSSSMGIDVVVGTVGKLATSEGDGWVGLGSVLVIALALVGLLRFGFLVLGVGLGRERNKSRLLLGSLLMG